MAKRPNVKPNEKSAQNISLTPVQTLGGLLALVGKPFYLILSHLVLGIIFILLAIGKTTRLLVAAVTRHFKWLFTTIIQRKKENKKQKAAKKLRTNKRVNQLKFQLPNFKLFFKLEKLRVNLFELKILFNFKRNIAKIGDSIRKFRSKFKSKLFIVISVLIFLLFNFYFLIFKDLPSPKDLDTREPEVSTKIYDRNGNLLYKIYKDKNRTIVPLTQIPQQVRLATLAAEDAEFYSHPGFSIKGIFRAVITDIRSGSLQGGSTITQQLVKNTLLSPEKTILRKIKEIILSVEVEYLYTKDQILEMYLNEVSYGGTAYGIQEASLSYFGKDARDLTLAEAALLAGLPKSPTLYSPFGQNPDLAFERQKEVLHLMVVNKFITKSQETEAVNQKLRFLPKKTEIKAPHFVMYVRQMLVDKYGEDMVEKGGLEVTTSLDLNIQNLAEKIVSQEVDRIKNLHVGNGAALVVNPQTGEILSMVGSKNYFDTAGDGNVNVLTRLRQPGSSIKVVNYAYALGNGFTPATIINDSPIIYSTPGSPPYSPQNYDGKFIGNVSLRNALAQSRNIPAVKVLVSYGVPKMIEQGRKMGITSWDDPSKYGLSLTLGGGAVKAIELVRVYGVLANYGKRMDLIPILSVKDYKGRILEKNTPNGEQVLDPRIAFSLTDILKDNPARAPEFGLNSYLVIKNHPEVAVKTGTSNDLRDNWAVGYNQNFLVLTWVGNNDNSPMSHVASGVTGASPIWNKIISALLTDQLSIDWKAPEGVSKINICTLTGNLPCNGCPTRQEWFLDEKKPTHRICATPIPVIQEGNILNSGSSTRN
ncbi:MAG: PBP1A family penicillin-binding protein [Candidatus Woesebacteria bacterium]|nr:MAG: PBP1A family penicillin-binding protein [Candidatus Woesebacteria bacterium]